MNHIDSYDYEWLDEQHTCVTKDWLALGKVSAAKN